MEINIIYLYVAFEKLINFSHPSKGLGEGHLNPKPPELWLHGDCKLLQRCLPETVDSSRVLGPAAPFVSVSSSLSWAELLRQSQGLLWSHWGSDFTLGAGAAAVPLDEYSRMLSDFFPAWRRASMAFSWGALETFEGVEIELLSTGDPQHTPVGITQCPLHCVWSALYRCSLNSFTVWMSSVQLR